MASAGLPLLSGACGQASGAPAGQAPSSQGQPSRLGIRVGVVGASTFTPYHAGVALGLFERDGLDVEIVDHRGGAEAAQAMIGGGVDLFNGDFSHALRLNQQGQQIRAIAGVTDRHNYTLIGGPGAGAGAGALKGQKVAITSPGSQTDNSMRWLLKTNGLDPDRDAELISIGGGTPTLAALENKQVYAGMVVEPYTSQLSLGGYVTVYNFPEDAGPFQSNVMMARQAYLAENGDAVRRFLKSYLGVVKVLKEDESARRSAMQQLFPQLEPRVADAAVGQLVKAYPSDGKVSEAAIDKVVEFDRVARGVDEPIPPLSTFVDHGYLP